MSKIAGRCEAASEYCDPIAWACYRAGWYKMAFTVLVDNATEERHCKNEVAIPYHLYFICRRLGFDDTAAAIKRFFAEIVEKEFPYGMYSIKAPLYELEYRNVSDTTMTRC